MQKYFVSLDKHQEILKLINLTIEIMINESTKILCNNNAYSTGAIHQEELSFPFRIKGYLGISQKDILFFITTKDHEIDNEIPHIKIGNTYYFSKQAVNDWFQKANIEIP